MTSDVTTFDVTLADVQAAAARSQVSMFSAPDATKVPGSGLISSPLSFPR